MSGRYVSIEMDGGLVRIEFKGCVETYTNLNAKPDEVLGDVVVKLRNIESAVAFRDALSDFIKLQSVLEA